MPRLDQAAPAPAPALRNRNAVIGRAPGFWIAGAEVFLANAVLSSLYGEYLSAVLGLVTTGASLVAAAAWHRHLWCECHQVDAAGHSDVRAWSAPDLPLPDDH